MADIIDELRAALQDRYRVERELGRGGMATVYLADDFRHGRQVAIKVLSPDFASSIGAERFLREIQITARLAHPHILPIYDSGETNGLLYYVMPFIEGESLRQRIDRDVQMPIDDAIELTCEVAEALGYAHQHGVIHRDVKPENILLHGGHAVVADFGIARMVEDAGTEKLTATGMSVGTAHYMSPEQFSGGHLDGRSDLYSLGCVLYEMLVGDVPFTGKNSMAIMARATMEMPGSIHIVRSSVPEQVEEAVMRALEKVPADRYPDMKTFIQALTGPVTGTFARRAMRNTRTYAVPTPQSKWTRGRIIAAIAAGLVLLTGGALAAKSFWPGRPSALAAGDARANHVAVLYFSDESPRGDLRFLADGLTETLIDRLSDVQALDVVSRDGVRPFRGGEIELDSIARLLKVGSIVRGSVIPDGKKVKVNIRLVDALSGADLEKKGFSVDTANMSELRQRVATDVSEFLRKYLGDQVRLRDQRNGTLSTAAWSLVQRAEKQRKDADSLAASAATAAALQALGEADSLLARAEAEDRRWPTPPTMRAAVATSRAKVLQNDEAKLGAVIDSGIVWADRALALDPRNADALEHKGALLWLRYSYHLIADPREADRTLAVAESTLTAAVNIDRNQAGAWVTLSQLQYRKPDIQAALRAAQEAYRADAYLSSAKAVLASLFVNSYNTEQYPEAMRWCNEGKHRFPRDPFFVECSLWMYWTAYKPSDPDSAWAYLEEYVSRYSDLGRPRARLKGTIFVAGALARATLRDSARNVLARVKPTPEMDPKRELKGIEAPVRVMLGEHDEAVRLIADYLTINPEHRKGFATRPSPWWRDLQTNAKFKALIAGAR